MKNLPVELLSHIFTFLNQDDQLECMLTCHLWNGIIEEFCLFKALNIYSHRHLKKISKKIQQQPNIGNNVDQLKLYLYGNDNTNLTDFLEKLPLIQAFHCFGRFYVEDKTEISWHKHIETLMDTSDHSVAFYLLSTGVCPNLVELNIFDDRNELISLLKNAPALRSLTLNNGSITFEDLNLIDRGLCDLRALKLRNKELQFDTYDKDMVTSAISVTGLFLIDFYVPTLESLLALLQFITKKYPNLVNFVYAAAFCPTTQEEREILNLHGWQPLLEKFGPQLKKLHVNYTYQIPDFLEKLDACNSQIQDLKIHQISWDNLPKLGLSQQALHIRNLVLYNVEFNSILWLKELKLLESLEILAKQYDVPFRLNFDDIIENAPPLLQSLTLGNIRLKANPTSAIQSTIKNLSFVDSKLPNETAWFIDRHFPLLSSLKIKNCESKMKEFTLRSANLDSFYLIDKKFEETMNLLIRTIYDSAELWYSIKVDKYFQKSNRYRLYLDDSKHPPVRPQSVANMNEKPDFILCCYSVKKVILCR